MAARKTVVVLEHSWDDTARPSNKDVSIIPYVDGVCRLRNYELFYGRYVGNRGFDEWVDRFRSILQDKDRRIILYVAGHGSERTIGGKRVETLLKHMQASANDLNIEGCILGGCYVGSNTQDFKKWMSSCNLVWLVGYRYAVDWLPSTLCDISIIDKLLSTSDSVLKSKASLTQLLQDSLSFFDPASSMSADQDGNRHSLSDTISCVIQPRGQGQKPVDINIAEP